METTSKDLIQVKDLQFVPFIDEVEIKNKVETIGKAIAEQYAGKNPIFISVLNGAFIFTADLMRATPIASEVAFTQLASYEGTTSTGKVKTLIELKVDLKDRHVIVVEDIVDTGKTLYYFLDLLRQQEPASLAVAALLVKPDAIEHHFPIDFIGFNIPTKFVVGYGLDYNDAGRQLGSIYQLYTEEK